MRICSYLRISTLSQKDNTSIETQKNKVQGFCSYNEHELVAEFIEEAKSGKSTDRPKYNEMMDFIRDPENKIDAVVVYKADRIHRSIKNLMIMIDELEELEVAFISLTESFDTSTPQGRLFLQMIGSFAEFERNIINERTKSGRITNAEKNVYAGGKVPLGYTVDEEGNFLIDEPAATIVRDIFKLRSKGLSTVKIAKIHGMSKQRVAYILKNETYIGKYTYDGKKEKNKINLQIPKIISEYMYKKVNFIDKKQD